MNRIKVIILLLVLLGIGVVTNNYVTRHHGIENITDGDDEADKQMPHPDVNTGDGEYVIKVPKAIQQHSGIKTVELTVSHPTENTRAVAYVMDTIPLVTIAARYHEQEKQVLLNRSSLEYSSAEYKRLVELHKEAANISGKDLQAAKLKVDTDRINMQTGQVALADIKAEAIQSWGDILTDQIIHNTGVVEDVMERESAILQVTFPVRVKSPPTTIKVSHRDNPEDSFNATYISPATTIDSRYTGLTFFYETRDSSVRGNMYLNAWYTDDENLTGIYIPESAIVWYADKPWVYLETSKGDFARTEVTDYRIDNNGWFTTSGFREGEHVVITGAQMLLSEEFRWSIPDEDDNP